jgi:hypothetical protein
MVLAFPGAQGFGKDTIGGRGGRIVHVTNRNNSGTGSFRDAVETQSGARTVVFDVGGTITLTSNINITNGNITIAGESAPSPGIAITGGDIRPRASEIIIRHISFHSSGTVGSSPDTIGIAYGGTRLDNIIIDHCDIQYGADECLQIFDSAQSGGEGPLIVSVGDYRLTGITVQNCLISESLSGKGTTIVGAQFTMYRNMTAYNSQRCLCRCFAHSQAEVVNNMGFNSAGTFITVGDSSYTTPAPVEMNEINNRGVFGPSGSAVDAFNDITATSGAWETGSLLYQTGVVVVGGNNPDANTWPASLLTSSPAFTSNIASADIIAADSTLESVLLANVGARPLARHPMATRTLNRIIARTGGFQTGTSYASYGRTGTRTLRRTCTPALRR